MTTNVTSNMMDDLFSVDSLGSEDPPFHLISTDHPYMAHLGLATFTTGTLYRWWNQKDGAGNYENQKYFELPFLLAGGYIAQETYPILLLLGTETSNNGKKDHDEGKNQFAFQAWRSQSADAEGRRSGKYETKYIDLHTDPTELWHFVQAGKNAAGDNRIYYYGDLDLEEYDDQFLEEDGELDDEFEMPDGQGRKENVEFKGIAPITNAIVLNDYVRNKELDTLFRDGWEKQDFARNEFILDIQASKEGYIEWSGLVPFYLSLASGDAGVGDTFKCLKKEWVKYRLYLYPNSAPRSSRRGIVMATPTFAGPPMDSLGRRYQKREDGAFSAFPVGSQAAEVVAELDMTYNQYTGKWEAGSKQMIGIVTQRIPRAQTISVKRMRELSSEDMLRLPNDPNSHIIWGSGSAMPLSQQNANPMQWTPNYAEPSQLNEDGKFEPICPEEPNKTKVEFRVFNASAKVLNTDQMVLLNQIDGQWFAIDFPSGIEDLKDEITPGFEGRWEFSYCATNVVHHFRDKEFGQIDSDDIVRGFHKKYYEGDDLNWGTHGAARDIDNRIDGGYHQFTSFDMMDKYIAGTRTNGNAYATTNSVTAPNGERIEEYKDGFHTGAFFGCIFPEGYDSEQIAEYRVHRDPAFKALPTVAKSGASTDNLWKPRLLKHPEFQYFNDAGIQKEVGPFDKDMWDGFGPIPTIVRLNDCANEHIRDADGHYITMFHDDQDSALTNLPADIATNAAPSGKNGQPIPNLHMIEEMYRNAKPEGVRDFFKLGKNWLRREYEESEGTPVHMESSAFDFSPKKSNHIIFRPLKAEVYAQFSQDNTQYTGPGAGHGSLNRHDFGGEMCTQMISRKKPSSDIAHQRERNWDTIAPRVGGFEVADHKGKIYPIYNDYWGLQFNIDIPDAFVDLTQHHYKISLNAHLPRTSRFRYDVWGEDQNQWCHGGHRFLSTIPLVRPPWRSSEFAPAGAVGIIGAVCSCTAKNIINCVTKNRLGVWSWGAYAGTGKTDQEPAWGRGNNYKDFQTTLLAVKVYHSWPREDTVYDPRYFAVHHFNAGILGFNDSGFDGVNGVPFLNTIEEAISQTDGNGDLKTYDYEIDELGMYNVDYRVPSARFPQPVENDTNFVHELSVGDMIWKNSAYAVGIAGWEDGDWEHVGSLLEGQWKIDTSRRGKLLPYKFQKKTISMLKVVDDVVMNDADVYDDGGYAVIYDDATATWEAKPIKDLPNNGEQDHDVNIAFVIRDPGKGYAEGDTFTTPTASAGQFSKGVEVQATQVDNGVADGPGVVTGLKVIEQGSDFSYSAFVAFDKPITKTSLGGTYFINATIENGGSKNGTGFTAFLVSGTVREVVVEDKKPENATDVTWHLLSTESDSNNTRGYTPVGNAGPFGLINGKTEDRDIEIDNHNEIDGKYDLFFRFHNDISHTLLSSDHAGAFSRWCNDEQYVELTITTS